MRDTFCLSVLLNVEALTMCLHEGYYKWVQKISSITSFYVRVYVDVVFVLWHFFQRRMEPTGRWRDVIIIALKKRRK